jgi:mevalonate kinase
MHGALALAIPLRFGQSLEVSTGKQGLLDWQSIDTTGIWFAGKYDISSLEILESTDHEKALILQQILKSANKMSNGGIEKLEGIDIHTHANFDRHWGLGTSSTLLHNLAHWLGISAYDLLWDNFKGSGYDIACAGVSWPILYQLKDGKPQVSKADFSPEFADQIWFIYSGEKQDTSEGIRKFSTRGELTRNTVSRITGITQKIVNAVSVEDFISAVFEHEDLLAGIIPVERIQNKYPGFRGTLKSLGAWGGDFFMAVTSEDERYVRDFFKIRGLDIIFRYDEIIL